MPHIVVGVDGSGHAQRALRWAAREAELWDATVELIYGYLAHPHAFTLVYKERDTAEAEFAEIKQRAEPLLEDRDWSGTLIPGTGPPAAALIRASQRADLVVVGSRGLGGFKRLLLGSTSYRTAAHAGAPVAVVRSLSDGETLDGRRRIVVGADGSRTAQRAVRWALDEARRRGVGITVAHAYAAPGDVGWDAPPGSPAAEVGQDARRDAAMRLLDGALAGVDLPAGVDVVRAAEPGAPAGVLLDLAGSDSLLVLGAHGHDTLGRLTLGSVSHQCLHHADGPVVVVP